MGDWDDEEEDDDLEADGPEFSFECDCGRSLTVPVEMAGGTMECPWCKKEVRVPGGGDDESAEDAPETENEEKTEPDRCPCCAALCATDECPSCHVAPLAAQDWEILPYAEDQRVVTAASADWILRRARWLLSKQTRAEFLARPLVLPTAEFFPENWSLTQETLDDLLLRMQTWLGLADCPTRIDVKDDVTTLGGLLGPGLGGEYAAGCIYAPQWVDEVARILVERSLLRDRIQLVATLSHELGHLFGFVRLDCIDAPPFDNEPLTDLISVMHGMGCFATDAAHRFMNQNLPGGAYIHGWRRSGYLSQPELAFALALFCAIRGIAAAQVSPHLSLNPRTFFQDSLRFLEDTPAAVREATALLR